MRFYLTGYLTRHVPLISRLFHGYGTWVLFDIPIVLAAFVLALLGRAVTTELDLSAGLLFTVFVLAAFLFANYVMGNYRRYWSYAAAHDVMAIFSAAILATAAILVVEIFITPRPLPYSVVVAGGFFAFAGMTAIRYRRRLFSGTRWAVRNSLLRLLADGKPTLILGAGESGQALAFHIQMSAAGRAYYLAGFLDDNPEKIGKLIHGLPVLGACDQVAEIARSRAIELIIIAIHNIPPARLHRMIDRCMQTSAQIRLLPDQLSTLEGSPALPALREVTVGDLLGRQPLAVDVAPAWALLRGRRVLVTGAAGSIGRELARQIARAQPAQLILLDNNETGLHEVVLEMRHALAAHNQRDPLLPIVGDVTQAADIEHLFHQHRPQHVFHAAAYKHVYWMERFPLQAIRTNVLGTHTLLQASLRFGVERFLLVSSDKAADPSSVMGATKRLCEMLVLSAEAKGEMLCAAVRFGNVLGSRGSVVPTFERQIAAVGPVTITDPRMRRFFMSTSEAVSLLLLANSLTSGRDLFMLDMGEEVSILELANRMMRLRGLRPETDIPVTFTGIGQGEKLSEQLLGLGEKREPTSEPGIVRVGVNPAPPAEEMARVIGCLHGYAQTGNEEAALALLWSLVESRACQPSNEERVN
ncbi:MAG: polysaccharide biosynthesis protein [Chloroflexi bacterium]|nr:MAG: polysaccharide biosynthesis protein [Chloroflexota bacterium]